MTRFAPYADGMTTDAGITLGQAASYLAHSYRSGCRNLGAQALTERRRRRPLTVTENRQLADAIARQIKASA